MPPEQSTNQEEPTHYFRLVNKLNEPPAKAEETSPVEISALPLLQKTSEPLEPVVKMPTQRQQSWGAVISIVVIVLMVIIGAFYSWGKRINESNIPTATTTGQ